MQPQLLSMLQMQDAMNTKVNTEWRAQEFPWYRAIWVECAELMDHYGWKWWKKQDPDMEQVLLELVDIWHFGLSDQLQKAATVEAVAEALTTGFQQELLGIRPFRDELEGFVDSVITGRCFDVQGFRRLMASVSLDFDTLHSQYVGKNILNFFRQDHGYQEGSYKKIWRGKEDNEHLVEVLAAENPSSSSFRDDVYRALASRYALA